MPKSKLQLVKTEGRGRPAKISREQILAEARALGAVEITFARIAERLGVRHAALYYHFKTRDEILKALALELAKEFHIEPGPARQWRKWLEDTTLAFYDFLLKNPAVLATDNWRGLSMCTLPILEAVLETLQRAGFSLRDAGRAWEVVGNMAIAEARVITDASRAGPVHSDSSMYPTANAFPHSRAMYAMLMGDPRKHFAETAHWIIAALPAPRAK